MTTVLTRAWTALAPKLIAFLAAGLTSSGLIYVATLFHVTISAPLAVIIVGGVSTVAAYIQRDNLLSLSVGSLSLKVLVFAVTSVSATTVVAVLQQFGVDLTGWAPVIGVALTVIGTVIGYAKADTAPPKSRVVVG
jgi:hypothetical protein